MSESFKIGDWVIAKIWKGNSDGRTFTVKGKVVELSRLRYEVVRILVHNEPEWTQGTWWVYKNEILNDPNEHASGYVLERTSTPAGKDPYANGPYGETNGPSGLLWL